MIRTLLPGRKNRFFSSLLRRCSITFGELSKVLSWLHWRSCWSLCPLDQSTHRLFRLLSVHSGGGSNPPCRPFGGSSTVKGSLISTVSVSNLPFLRSLTRVSYSVNISLQQREYLAIIAEHEICFEEMCQGVLGLLLVFTHGWNISEPEVRGNMVKDLKTRAFEREISRLAPQVVNKNRSNVPLDIS